MAYVNLGAALVSAGRCQEAVTILRQGSRLDGSGLKDRRQHETAKVSALLQLGALYADQGRLQRAVATYKEALHTMPHYYPPQVNDICFILVNTQHVVPYNLFKLFICMRIKSIISSFRFLKNHFQINEIKVLKRKPHLQTNTTLF